MLRTHEAGTLRAEHAGTTVTLAGWVARRRDHGGVAFLDLRDASGIAQVVVRDEAVAHGLRAEYVLQVTGEVGRAPGGQREPGPGHRRGRGRRRPSVEVLNESAPLPFQIDEHVEVGEEARLKLPLPRPAPAGAGRARMRLRAEVNRAARDVLLDARTSSRSRPRR